MTIEILSEQRCCGGTQGFYRHASTETGGTMKFGVFRPPLGKGEQAPVLYFLAGLTCTEETFAIKAGAQRLAAELGLIVVTPDTSPRDTGIDGATGDWEFGEGAGFYLDATTPAFAPRFRMYSYVTNELPAVLAANFTDADASRESIFGHSMGGHGALTIALKNPERYASCSAFAPIVHPMTAGWSKPALEKYLCNDDIAWRQYDACALIEDGFHFREFLVDQGAADGFLDDGLRPWLLAEVCEKAGIPLTLNMRDGYDHSYFFISTFMDDHLRWHAKRLAA